MGEKAKLDYFSMSALWRLSVHFQRLSECTPIVTARCPRDWDIHSISMFSLASIPLIFSRSPGCPARLSPIQYISQRLLRTSTVYSFPRVHWSVFSSSDFWSPDIFPYVVNVTSVSDEEILSNDIFIFPNMSVRRARSHGPDIAKPETVIVLTWFLLSTKRILDSLSPFLEMILFGASCLNGL